MGTTFRRVVRNVTVAIATLALAAVGVITVLPGAANAFGPTSVLSTNQALAEGQALQSPNGLYTALLQTDGNFVLYRNFNGTSRPLWSDGMNNYFGPNHLVMQSDCNLVDYLWNNAPLWSSRTGGRGSGCTLMMQNDGNLVIYNSASVPAWASNTGTPAVTGQVVYGIVVAGQSNATGWESLASQMPLPSPAVMATPSFFNQPDMANPNPSINVPVTLGTPQVLGGPAPSTYQVYGPELYAAAGIEAAHPGAAFDVIKVTKGGTNLASDWNPNATSGLMLYRQLVAEVNEARAWATANGDTFKVAGIIWVQGEADAMNATMANAYAGNLRNLISAMRSNISSTAPIVITKTSVEAAISSGFIPYVGGCVPSCAAITAQDNLVRSDQQAVASPAAHVYNVDDAPLARSMLYMGGLHLSYAGEMSLGQQAASLINANWSPS